MQQTDLLEELITILSHSTAAYKNYLAGGKTFRFATELKFYNGKALQLLTTNQSFFQPDIQEAIRSLINHYTEWTRKWEKLDLEKKHGPDDVFAFENDAVFPREAEQQLRSAYEKLEPPPVAPAVP